MNEPTSEPVTTGQPTPPPYGFQPNPNPYPTPPAGYGPPPVAYGPPAGPKAKRRKWPWIVLGVVVLLGSLAAVNGSKNPGTTSTAGESDSNAAGDAAQSTPALPGLGTPVRDGKFEFVVEGAEGGKTQIGNEFLSKAAQGEFVLVTLQVKNIGDEPQSFFGSNVKAFDSQGRQFEASTEAAIYLGDSNSLYEPINPGNSLTGQVIFDVPSGTQLTAVELHDSMFSDGVRVQL